MVTRLLDKIMNKSFNNSDSSLLSRLVFTLCLFIFSLGVFSNSVFAGIETSFLYSLSNFSGPVKYRWANVLVDLTRNEVYVVDSSGKDIRIFNDQGMEIFRFDEDLSLGQVIDLAVKEDGNILVLSKTGQNTTIIVCDFRGRPKSELELKDLPSSFSGFSPHRLVYKKGLLYLLDVRAMKIVVTEPNGTFRKGYEIFSLLQIEDKKRGDTQIEGFAVDQEGNILFTIPVLFSAFRLSPEGQIWGFGRAGGAPGGFNIAAGIAADHRGYYYVADRLKSAVIVFDRNLRFVKEFGYRGFRPDNLIAPKDLAVDAEGRLYVSQVKVKGISVFKITYNQ
jgi:DNA-binding beta-propeller fold protein YncE